MPALSIQPPFPIFTDIDGQPLEDGFILIGAANLDPQGNPIAVYWDEALLVPATQPIRTLAGYPSRSGTPARLYVNSDYSIRVLNKNGSVVYSSPVATEVYSPVVVQLTSADISFVQAGNNAVTRTSQDKMREWVSVKDFGAVGDGVTDDTAAIQAALAYAYSVAAGPSWRIDTPTVYFPKGNYRVAQANTLFQGLTLYTGKILGSGRRGGTQIIYDVPSAGASDYLFYNNNSFGFVQFHGIRFVSARPAPTTNQKFMYYYSTGQAQNFSFTECEFEKFSLIFDVQGNANASENTFVNCLLSRFSDCAVRINNGQSLNWRFYGCDAENFTGTMFEFLQAGNILWSQGSIIPIASTARIMKVPAGADPNTFGGGSSPQVVFTGARFEMQAGSLMVEKVNAAAIFTVTFDSCSMGGGNIPSTTYKMFTWAGAGNLELRSCDGFTNYRFGYTADGVSDNILRVRIRNCVITKEFIQDSTFTLSTGSNVGYFPIFDVLGCGSRVDGMYRPRDSEFMNSALDFYNGVTKTLHGLSFSPEANAMAITAGQTYNVYVPSTRVIGIRVFPVANPGGAGDATITIKNAAGTVTLGTATWTMTTPATTLISVDCNYFVDATAGDYLTVQFAHSYTPGVALTFKGQLYLLY